MIPLDNLNLEDDNLEHFYERIDVDDAYVNENFRYMKYKNNFMIKNIRDSKNPTGLLLHFFDKSISTAISVSKQFLKKPGRIGIILRSPNLEREINRPFRTIRSGMNRAIYVLHEFKKVNQSSKNGSLLDAPIRMEIVIKSDEQGRGRISKEKM